MFKVVKSATYSAMKNEISENKAVIGVLKEDLNKAIEQRNKHLAEYKERGNRISELIGQRDACKAMREDLSSKLDASDKSLASAKEEMEAMRVSNRKINNQLESLKADLAKQGDELVLKSDELKQLRKSNQKLAGQIDDAKEKLQLGHDNHTALGEKNKALVEGLTLALAEMRKVNRGKPSHNKSRAFQILERTLAAAKTETEA